MCESCEATVAQAKREIQHLLNRENFDGHTDIPNLSESTVAGLIAVRCAIITAHDTDASNDLNGAPISIILGSYAGIAMQAEAMNAEAELLLARLFGGRENLN
jgi:hypothetical protein